MMYRYLLFSVFLAAFISAASAQEPMTPSANHNDPDLPGSFSITQPAEPPTNMPTPPVLQDVPEEPREKALTGADYKAAADEAYSGGEYDRALNNYKSALPLLNDPKEQARVHERLAFIYSAFGKTDSVYAEFLEALKLDRTLELDQNMVSPKIYESFVKARGEVVREGVLICNCDPSGAEVYLDGELLGEAPVKKEHLPEGEHALTLKKSGYEPSAEVIQIKKDVTLTVEDKMVEARGELAVTTNPPGTTVLFDGKEAGISPLTVKRINSGEHTVTLRRDYFEKREIKEQFAVSEKKTLNATLKRRLLLITIASGSDGKTDTKDQVAEFSGNIAEKLKGFLVVPADIEKLCSDLTRKGLDPASLDFARKQKACMNLEDAAVLASILEQENAEIALVVHLEVSGDKARLKAGLMTSTNSLGDNEQFDSDDFRGAGALFNAYLEKWLAQENPVAPSIGVQVADRAAGGVEVTRVLPGYPAAKAGVAPGCMINRVDDKPVMKKSDLTGMLKPGARQRLGLSCRGMADKADVDTVNSPVEAPMERGGYLYNLAQLEFADQMAASPADEAGKDARGIAALNLGNVLMHFGEYAKAVKAYSEAHTSDKSGVCSGTALFRLGGAYEKLGQWTDAADAYRKATLLYPDATLDNAEGPMVGPLARERLKELYKLGLTMERWWL